MTRPTVFRDADKLWATVVLWPSKAIVVSENIVTEDLGFANEARILLDVTNADTVAGDTLDVYIDISPDFGTTWINVGHFPQFTGVSAAAMHWMFLNPAYTGTTTIAVTTDAAAGTIRQIGLTDRIRVRAVVVNVANPSFTFSVKAYLRG